MNLRPHRARRCLAGLAASALVAFGLVAGTGAASNATTLTSAGTALAPAADAPLTPHTITFDKYSLMIDGQRTFIWSGEFHYWRLPSPSLWLDVLQKMKAEGYNAVSIYFNWAYHSPAPGVYDFTGVRDVDQLLDDAQQVGLYVIARPGPYINAETNGGGFPGWLTQVAGTARGSASDYLAAADDWMHHIDAILARHQLTNGTGTVIAEQIENELGSTGTSQKTYMQNLADTVHGDGITVPIFSNASSRSGVWVPPSSTVPGTVVGPTDLYAWDAYPGGTCSTSGNPSSPGPNYDWGLYSTGGATGGDTASPFTPGFAAEFGGGWFDYWGSVGTYPCTAIQQGAGYERRQYGVNIANGITMENFYMTFGGTSWGWLPAPVVYTSYDYGAAFDEARQIRPKASAMKELGLFLQAAQPVVTQLDKGPAITPSNSAIKVYSDVDSSLGTHLYVAVHATGSTTSNDAFTFTATTSDGTYTIPASGTLRVNGQDSKILLADYDLLGQHLVYSTSQLMTDLTADGQDVALLYAPNGESGETVLRYSSQPTVTVLSGGAVSSNYNAATGDLRLDYTHNGLTEVSITGGGRTPLLLLLADSATADTFWRPDTGSNPVLVRGPELVRTASFGDGTLALTGDTSNPADLEVWGAGSDAITWNGAPVATGATASGSQLAASQLAGAAAVTLPDLTQATWKVAVESPESEPGFDDSSWTVANKTTTTSTSKPPSGKPVLTADDYGFNQGAVWYRGTYTGDGKATSIALNYGGGGAGMLQAWLDGVYLGQNVLGTNSASPPTTGTATLTIPVTLAGTGPHELSVMVLNDGHNEDNTGDSFKEGRGLISATFSAGGTADNVSVGWKIQGNLGGENIVDTARGIDNIGGLFGERNGWFLPGFPDSTWPTTTLPVATAQAGTTWYRTTFNLNVPTEDDASLGVTIGNPAVQHSGGNYRALIFVNGWNMGEYIANVGPQHTFVVPDGILNPQGENTLAIAVISNGGSGNGLEAVTLTNLGTVRGGVPVTMNAAPGWSEAVYGPPTVPGKVLVNGVTADAGTSPTSPVVAGGTIHVSASVTNYGASAASGLTATLNAPSGWTVTGGDVPSGLDVGATANIAWTVQVPKSAATGTDALTATVGYTAGGTPGTTGGTATVNVRGLGDQYVSDLPWITSTNGYGPVERDESVGGTGSGDGAPITLRGTVYPKGLGTNSVSSVVLTIPTGCTTFTSDVGIDDAAGGRGTVTFTVLADGVTVASTGTITGTSAVVHLSANVAGASTLTLNVGDAGDGNGHDNADWAGAELHCRVPSDPIGLAVPGSGVYGGSGTLSSAGGGSSAPVIYSVDASSDPGACAVSGATVSYTGVGNCVVDANQAGDTFYLDAAQQQATIAVEAAPLRITASDAAVTYGDGPAVISPSYSGFVNGEDASVLSATPVCTTSVDAGTPVGSYASTCAGAVDPDYAISYTDGTVTVASAPLTITASDASAVYGAAAPTIAPSYSGFVNGEDASALTAAPVCTTSVHAGSPVGTYASNCSGAADPNYAIGYVAGSVSVTPAPLEITASSVTVPYTSPTPTITPIYSGFVNGEVASVLTVKPVCQTAVTTWTPPGDYPSTCSGAAAADYTIGYAAGTVTVTPPPAWSATAVYTTGGYVTYQGSIWLALFWTQNQKPGDPNGPWQQIAVTGNGTPVWTASRVFNAGDLVSYQGGTWLAAWYTRNQAPGDPNGPWEQIATAPDGNALWTATRIFQAGDTAVYQGKTYTAQWYTRNQQPGLPNGPWKLTS